MSEPTIQEAIDFLQEGYQYFTVYPNQAKINLAIRALEEMREREKINSALLHLVARYRPNWTTCLKSPHEMSTNDALFVLNQIERALYEGEEKELDLSGKVKYEKTGSEYMDISRAWIKPHTWRDISASSIVESFKSSNFDFHPNGPLKEAAERVVNTVLGSQKPKPRTWDKVTLGEVDELAKAQGERLDDDPTVWTNWRNRLRFLGEKAVNNKPLDRLTTWRSLT